MANNLTIVDGAGASKTLKTTDTAGVHTPHHNFEINGTAPTLGAGAADAGTLRTVAASDDPIIAALAPDSNNRSVLSAAATTNATSVKASSGRVFRVIGYNAAASARFLKFYNKASAPTVGTDTPVLTLYLAATSRFNEEINLSFSTGIAFALTTGIADADTGALTLADILGLNVLYR